MHPKKLRNKHSVKDYLGIEQFLKLKKNGIGLFLGNIFQTEKPQNKY